MNLYILRHAIAEERSSPLAEGDAQRPLTAEGRTKMRRAAKGMKSMDLNFDLILTSPYVRARETADIVTDVFEVTERLKVTAALAAGGNPKDLVDELRRQRHRHQNILVIGHEPYLSRLISLLISGDTGIPILLKKGGLCKLTTASLHYGRCATLEWLLTPAQLRSLR